MKAEILAFSWSHFSSFPSLILYPVFTGQCYSSQMTTLEHEHMQGSLLHLYIHLIHLQRNSFRASPGAAAHPHFFFFSLTYLFTCHEWSTIYEMQVILCKVVTAHSHSLFHILKSHPQIFFMTMQ